MLSLIQLDFRNSIWWFNLFFVPLSKQQENMETEHRVIIAKSISQKDTTIIRNSMSFALGYMREKYPDTNFNNIDFRFGKGRNSKYWRNARRDDMLPCCQMALSYTLYLYNMKSLKLKKTSAYVGRELALRSSLIHELTHHHQYEAGLATGELLTTSNEVEHLQKHAPEIYKIIKG